VEEATPEVEAVDEPAATHAVCPLCGKSSSLKTFPSGPGTDVLLQAFRGRGRGRGFDVIPRGSALVDERLRESVLAKLRVIVENLRERGYPLALEPTPPTPAEVDSTLHVPTGIAAADEIAMARSTIEFLEDEMEGIEKDLARERELRRDVQIRNAVVRHRLDEMGRLQKRLIEASRSALTGLQEIRHLTPGTGSTDASVRDAVSGLRDLVTGLRELRALATFNHLPPQKESAP